MSGYSISNDYKKVEENSRGVSIKMQTLSKLKSVQFENINVLRNLYTDFSITEAHHTKRDL